MLVGIIFCTMGLLHGIFKYFVIRDAARDVYNGGGGPVLDFVIFVPIWLCIGTTSLLKHWGIYPFPFFGLLLYLVLTALLYGLMELEYKLGKPEVERQLAAIEKRYVAEKSIGKKTSKPARNPDTETSQA